MLKNGANAIVMAIFAIGLAMAVYALWKAREPAFIDPSDSAMAVRGKRVYDAYCAACHAADLSGQPNWRERMDNGRLPAPPHDETGHTWHHPDSVLIDITKNGLVPGRTAPAGYESDMPAYGAVLSDEDIIAVLAYIKSTWPPEVLEMQREVNRQHPG